MKPPDQDTLILRGASRVSGGGMVRVTASNPHTRGFESLRLHSQPWQERQLPPGLQTSTVETVRPDTPILRLSACISKEGHADEPERG